VKKLTQKKQKQNKKDGSKSLVEKSCFRSDKGRLGTLLEYTSELSVDRERERELKMKLSLFCKGEIDLIGRSRTFEQIGGYWRVWLSTKANFKWNVINKKGYKEPDLSGFVCSPFNERTVGKHTKYSVTGMSEGRTKGESKRREVVAVASKEQIEKLIRFNFDLFSVRKEPVSWRTFIKRLSYGRSEEYKEWPEVPNGTNVIRKQVREREREGAEEEGEDKRSMKSGRGRLGTAWVNERR
jgi:hypothetical protein